MTHSNIHPMELTNVHSFHQLFHQFIVSNQVVRIVSNRALYQVQLNNQRCYFFIYSFWAQLHRQGTRSSNQPKMAFVRRWKSMAVLIEDIFRKFMEISPIHRKDSLESKIDTYMDMETFVGKCPGYYFKKCLQTRNIMKTRIQYNVVQRSSLVRRCCTGYLDSDGECLPYCMAGCLNGNCTSPNHCTCYDGYEEDEFNR